MKTLTLIFVLLFSMTMTAQIGSESHPMTNEDVKKLTSAEIDSGVVVHVIGFSHTSFDISPEALLKLKETGVTQPVLDAMVISHSAQEAQSPLALPVPTLASSSANAALRAHAKETACAPDLSSCPTSGCYPADSDHGVMNMQKRNIPRTGQPVTLTFKDFGDLQDVAEKSVGAGGDIPATDRKKLNNLRVSGGEVGEGTLVQITGYLVGDPLPAHANTQESVNCSLLHVANNDFHIPFAETADSTDYEGIVVEMIPQGRDSHPGWNLPTLHKVMKMQKQVLVEGQLFYDNEHVVNKDPEDPIGGQPARSSLWEVHPITKFLVCNSGTCDPARQTEWKDLAEFDTGPR